MFDEEIVLKILEEKLRLDVLWKEVEILKNLKERVKQSRKKESSFKFLIEISITSHRIELMFYSEQIEEKHSNFLLLLLHFAISERHDMTWAHRFFSILYRQDRNSRFKNVEIDLMKRFLPTYQNTYPLKSSFICLRKTSSRRKSH